jgi:hypothetical protein
MYPAYNNKGQPQVIIANCHELLLEVAFVASSAYRVPKIMVRKAKSYSVDLITNLTPKDRIMRNIPKPRFFI